LEVEAAGGWDGFEERGCPGGGGSGFRTVPMASSDGNEERKCERSGEQGSTRHGGGQAGMGPPVPEMAGHRSDHEIKKTRRMARRNRACDDSDHGANGADGDGPPLRDGVLKELIWPWFIILGITRPNKF
jgi:hypothetical protein